MLCIDVAVWGIVHGLSQIIHFTHMTHMQDRALRDTIVFGVALHHAGLHTHDRKVVEELFFVGKVQVLVCTSTLACKFNVCERADDVFRLFMCTYALYCTGHVGKTCMRRHACECCPVVV